MRPRRWWMGALLFLLAGLLAGHGQEPPASREQGPHGPAAARPEPLVVWPTADQVKRALALSDYNTRVVFGGVTLLGAAGGLVGTFLLLRKRSLLSDTVSHCTLPGITIAFLLGEALGVSERSLPLLLAGASASGVLGMMSVAAIRSTSRVKDDAALAIVLSVFFGLGIALLVVVQQLPTGNAAGLSRFIYGKTAAIIASDAWLIFAASLAIAVACTAWFKEFKLLCFDAEFARAQGWPVWLLDLALMSLVVAVTVIGLQAVGLLLVVALLIIPAAAARFWSDQLSHTAWLAALLGAVSGVIGAAASALVAKLPAGAVIVLAALGCFLVSFIGGTRRGLLVRWRAHRRVAAQVARQHLLRALYEWCETHTVKPEPDPRLLLERDVPIEEVRAQNHWAARRMRHLLRLGIRSGLLTFEAQGGTVRLSSEGQREARRVTRNHRLWELYLLRDAEVAPQHIHHNADQIEHVVDPAIVNELEGLLLARGGTVFVPPNPEPRDRHVPGNRR